MRSEARSFPLYGGDDFQEVCPGRRHSPSEGSEAESQKVSGGKGGHLGCRRRQ